MQKICIYIHIQIYIFAEYAYSDISAPSTLPLRMIRVYTYTYMHIHIYKHAYTCTYMFMYFIGRNMLPMQGCTCLYNTEDCLVLLAELCYLILIRPGNELTQESNGTDVYL